MGGRQHFNEMLRALLDANVEFLVVGGYAVMHYGEPRYTKDLKIWARTSIANAHAVYKALAAFGSPLKSDGIDERTFLEPNIVYQVGQPPFCVDLSTNVDGVDFDAAWSHKTQVAFFGVPVYVISLEDLIKNKEAAGRPQDRIDVEALKSRQLREMNYKDI